jgi:hypothetical protein
MKNPDEGSIEKRIAAGFCLPTTILTSKRSFPSLASF